MTEIIVKDQLLYLPRFSAGERLEVMLDGNRLDGTERIYLIVRNKMFNKTYAVSQEFNFDNIFTAELNFMTTSVLEDFSNKKNDLRVWVFVEAFDVRNQRSIGTGFTVLQNSSLLTGTTAEDIPSVKTLLTKDDFGDINFDNLETLDDVAITLEKVGDVVKETK